MRRTGGTFRYTRTPHRPASRQVNYHGRVSGTYRRRSTASWWRNMMISRSLERPERTVSRASDARNRYKIRYTRTQHRPASRQVNDHGRVSGTHTPPACEVDNIFPEV